MSASPHARDRAISIARTDFVKALDLARKVSNPWFRCQALAWVARFGPEGEVTRIAEEAVEAANKCDDAFQKVAALSWPVRALVERDRRRQAESIVAVALTRVAEVRHPVCRADALFLLIQAAWSLPKGLRGSLVSALRGACRDAKSWRTGRMLYTVALFVSVEDNRLAREIITSLPEGRLRRKGERDLAEGRFETPRAFFD